MAMTVPEFMKDIEERKNKPLIIGNCTYCHKAINEQQESKRVPAGIYHSDCYWEKLGNEVEKYPIGIGARGIRGNNLTQSDLEVATA